MSNSTPDIDIEGIRAAAKQRWLADNRKPFNLLDIVERSVPFWLVIIAAVLFGLSAPHTAAIFDKLTPGWGLLAPMGVEFGLLYTAFRRKRAKQTSDRVPRAIWALETLLFITAIVVNGSGSFIAVVSGVNLGAMPFGDIVASFGTFAAITQVALLLVPLAAFIIPIGTGVAGEGLAALVFERDTSRDDRAERWQTAQFAELYKAFFQAYVQAGVKPADAKRQAFQLASGFVQREQPSGAAPGVGAGGSVSAVTGDDKPVTQRERARRLLDENPGWHGLTLRELEERTGIDHNTWSIAKARHSSNGHERAER